MKEFENIAHALPFILCLKKKRMRFQSISGPAISTPKIEDDAPRIINQNGSNLRKAMPPLINARAMVETIVVAS
jgi:hypothetical protein